MKQLALDLAGPARPSLDNFITGVNGELLDHLKRLAARRAREQCTYVWGRAGSGRSHLLQATVAGLQQAGASAVYLACAGDTLVEGDLERIDCVALDDVDRLGDAGQAAAFELFNALRERGGMMLATAAMPPAQLALRVDLATRLAWGLVFQVHALTDEAKVRALAEHAVSRGFRLAPEVSDFLLTRARRDLSTLLATLDALDRYSLETRRPVTVPLARELLLAVENRGSRPFDGAQDRPFDGAQDRPFDGAQDSLVARDPGGPG